MTQNKSQSRSIAGKIRTPLQPEDFGVPREFAASAIRFANMLLAEQLAALKTIKSRLEYADPYGDLPMVEAAIAKPINSSNADLPSQ